MAPAFQRDDFSNIHGVEGRRKIEGAKTREGEGERCTHMNIHSD